MAPPNDAAKHARTISRLAIFIDILRGPSNNLKIPPEIRRD